MTDLGKAVVDAIPIVVPSGLELGTCVSVDWANQVALVNVNGQVIPVAMLAGMVPVPQRKCWVGTLNGARICLGAAAGPSLGKVSGAPASGKLPVLGDDGATYLCAYDPNVTSWSTGQRVLLVWAGGPGGGPVVTTKLSADPSAPDPNQPDPPVVGGGVRVHDLWFDPQWSGTQNGSEVGNGNFWTSQVYCGSTTLGAWGYGTSVADTIPDGAAINYVGVVLSQASGAGLSNPTIGVHSLTGRAGALTVSSAVAVAGGSGERQLPNSFGDALKTGSARGIGTHHGGYWIFNPAGVGGSGRLHIQATW